MILEQFSVSHPMCYFLNQIYDTGTVQCISSNVLLSQSDLWYRNSSVYLIQCVTHYLNQIYDTGTVQCISSNVLFSLSQSDLWYSVQCISSNVLLYDTGTVQCISSNVLLTFSIRSMILEQFSVSHPMCYSLSQSDLWYWNSSVYLIQCVTHFLNQIYDTGTVECISSNVLLTFSIRSMILKQFSVSHPMCYFLNQTYDTGTVQCISSNVLLTISIRSMILEQFSVSHPMCYSLSQSDLWYWNSSVYLIQCVTHFLNQIYDTGTVQCISSNVLLTFSIRSMILEQFSVSHPMCYFLNQISIRSMILEQFSVSHPMCYSLIRYDTGTVQCISSNVLLTFSIRSMILEQFSVSHPMCYSLSQSDLWYWNSSVYLIQCVTFSIRSMILEQFSVSHPMCYSLSQSDLWYWNSSVYLIQCVTHYLNQIYDNSSVYLIQCVTFSIRSMILEQFSVSHPMCYSLSQSDLWYWNVLLTFSIRSMILEQFSYLIQCVTHFLNQIYDTGTVQCISSNVLLTFSIRSMILEQFSVSHPMCYSLSQSDLWYWNSSVYHFLIRSYWNSSVYLSQSDLWLLTFSTRSMILEQEMLSTQCVTSLSQPDLWY